MSKLAVSQSVSLVESQSFHCYPSKDFLMSVFPSELNHPFRAQSKGKLTILSSTVIRVPMVRISDGNSLIDSHA